MLACLAAVLFVLGAVSDAENLTSSSPWLSWPVLACAGMALLALDQGLRDRPRKVKRSSEGDEP